MTHFGYNILNSFSFSMLLVFRHTKEVFIYASIFLEPDEFYHYNTLFGLFVLCDIQLFCSNYFKLHYKLIELLILKRSDSLLHLTNMYINYTFIINITKILGQEAKCGQVDKEINWHMKLLCKSINNKNIAKWGLF